MSAGPEREGAGREGTGRHRMWASLRISVRPGPARPAPGVPCISGSGRNAGAIGVFRPCRCGSHAVSARGYIRRTEMAAVLPPAGADQCLSRVCHAQGLQQRHQPVISHLTSHQSSAVISVTTGHRTVSQPLPDSLSVSPLAEEYKGRLKGQRSPCQRTASPKKNHFKWVIDNAALANVVPLKSLFVVMGRSQKANASRHSRIDKTRF